MSNVARMDSRVCEVAPRLCVCVCVCAGERGGGARCLGDGGKLHWQRIGRRWGCVCAGAAGGMYKNQLQELAQRSCFNLPAYASIREGPDHAPRFKATVNFNGEIFESPAFFSTLRQAEHAAAEIALTELSKRGPSQSLASRILDETGVFKNLLQETAQRAGVSLPVYSTIRSVPGQLPVFTSTVTIAGMTFSGEPAKTKKQSEKSAAMTAWSALKQWSKQEGLAMQSSDSEVVNEDHDEQSAIVRALAKACGKEVKSSIASSSNHSQYSPDPPSTRTRMVRSQEASSQHIGTASVGISHSGQWVSFDVPSGPVCCPMYSNRQPYYITFPPGHLIVPAYHTTSLGDPSGLHDSFRIQGSPRVAREIMASGRAVSSLGAMVPMHTYNFPSVSHGDRHDILFPLDVHQQDEEDWLRRDRRSPVAVEENIHNIGLESAPPLVHNSVNSLCSGASQWWGNMHASRHSFAVAASYGLCPATLAPPVRLRSMIAVNAAPPRPPELDNQESESKDSEGSTRQALGRLSL